MRAGWDSTPSRISADDLLMLKVILPPFSMIETMAKIIRVTPLDREGRISSRHPVCGSGRDEQELIIRHIPDSSRAATNEEGRA